jgi:hypothetical protein
MSMTPAAIIRRPDAGGVIDVNDVTGAVRMPPQDTMDVKS